MHISQLSGKTAISYARWSSGRQALGSSSARQTKIAAEYAAKAKMVLDGSIVDDGVSAFTGDNLEAGLGKFLDSVRSGQVPSDVVLLIENMDRFSRRNPMDALPTFLEVLKTGLIIVTLQDEMIHSDERYRENPMLLVPSLVSMQLAHDESLKKSIRLKGSWADRVKKIAAGERIPISKVPFWIDRKTQGFNNRVDDAREIFRLAAEGHGASAITRAINLKGIPSSLGGTWCRSMIQDVLKSKEAYGTLVIRGHEQPDYYPPIVSETVWLAIRNNARKQRRNPQAATDANLFPRLLKCGQCGSPMNVTTTSSWGKRYRYAACTGRTTSRNDCGAGNWPYDLLEEKFVGHLGAILATPDEPMSLTAEVSERDTLLTRLEALEVRKQNAIQSSIEAETADVQRAFREAADGFSRQIAAMRLQLAELAEAAASEVNSAARSLDIAAALDEAQTLRESDRPRLRGMVAAVVDAVTLEPYHRNDINVAVVSLRGRQRPFNLVFE
ncbi:recombinase family protein [Ciceribacter azotifigens]|uniref:recombinase family protein n=1 Tax=Ciceribacter azotifigens TaxID=2069303 RepID=UPI003A8A51B2